MVTIISHHIIRAILLFLAIFYPLFSIFVNSLTINSPIDGSTYIFGTAIPVNVMNSGEDTASTYTATFVCSAGTYQVTGLTIGKTYMLIPAGLHGLTNLVVTAAAGITAVATIDINGPVCPTPPPVPIYSPSELNPCRNCPCPLPPLPPLPPIEPSCANPCYPVPNPLCDPPPRKRTQCDFYAPISNNDRYSWGRPRCSKRVSKVSSPRQSGQFLRKNCYSPIVMEKSFRDDSEILTSNGQINDSPFEERVSSKMFSSPILM